MPRGPPGVVWIGVPWARPRVSAGTGGGVLSQALLWARLSGVGRRAWGSPSEELLAPAQVQEGGDLRAGGAASPQPVGGLRRRRPGAACPSAVLPAGPRGRLSRPASGTPQRRAIEQAKTSITSSSWRVRTPLASTVERPDDL